MYTEYPSGLSDIPGRGIIQQRESDDKPLKLLKLLYCEPDLLLAFPKAFLKSGFGIILARIVRYGTECTTRRFDLRSS
jgi:hypothetical protein